MRYLSLESSCDETAVAIWDSDARQFLREQVLTQIDLHSAFGGVVPGIAIREHLNGFPILIRQLKSFIDADEINALVVTHGPGLMGCLGIGIAYAQSLHILSGKPLYGVNHLQGHALSPFMEIWQANPAFTLESVCPHLGLLASGGNTLLFEISIEKTQPRFHVLAQTLDDAAGEALDKGAKLLGLPYPGGPFVEQIAKDGSPTFVNFPRAFPQKSEWHFSFSGIKTSLRYFLEKQTLQFIENNKPSICASYQAAIVDALCKKTQQALQCKSYKSLGLSGGVANNTCLRERFASLAQAAHIPFFVPTKAYCGDNAAMIAFAGSFLKAPVKLDPNRKLSDEN